MGLSDPFGLVRMPQEPSKTLFKRAVIAVSAHSPKNAQNGAQGLTVGVMDGVETSSCVLQPDEVAQVRAYY
ncbi:hypothetical protein KUIN1_13250 [Pseudomonas sp. KUIN-1]|nr:hypothetical protein KUIN1_13250 [Pseudomonas sp. KUIN-1]